MMHFPRHICGNCAIASGLINWLFFNGKVPAIMIALQDVEGQPLQSTAKRPKLKSAVYKNKSKQQFCQK
jgi:hypothetical protein